MKAFKFALLLTLAFAAHGADDDGDDDDDGPSPVLIFLNSSLHCTIGCQDANGHLVDQADIEKKLQPENLSRPPKGVECLRVQKNAVGYLKGTCLDKCNDFTKKLMQLSAADNACEASAEREHLNALRILVTTAVATFIKNGAHVSEVMSQMSEKETSKVPRSSNVGVISFAVGTAAVALVVAVAFKRRHARNQRLTDETSMTTLPKPSFENGNPYPTLASL